MQVGFAKSPCGGVDSRIGHTIGPGLPAPSETDGAVSTEHQRQIHLAVELPADAGLC